MRKLFLIFLLLFAINVEAATYYVATTGSDAAAGTIGAPWLTGQKCATTVVAGDTCLFRGGTYTHSANGTAWINVVTNGTAGNPITFKAYPGETPIINMQVVSGLAQTVKDTMGFTIYFSKAYIVIDGFEINGGEGGVVGYAGADNITVRNMHIHHGWNGGIACWNTCSNWLVEDNVVHDAIQKNWPRGTVDSCCDTWGGAITIASNVSNITYRRNTVYWNHGEGIVTGIGSSNILFDSNVVADCWSVCLYTDGGNNIEVRNNLIYLTTEAKTWSSLGFTTSNALGIGAAVEPDASFVSALDNLRIHDNVVVNTAACFRAFPEQAGHTFSNWYIYNNTCIDNDQGIRIDNSGAPITNITMRNNIVRSRGSGAGGRIVQFVPAPTGSNFFSNNIYDGTSQVFDINGTTMNFASWVAATGESNSFFTPPLLASYTTPCRLWNSAPYSSGACATSAIVAPGQLTSTSPAINTGLNFSISCLPPLNCTQQMGAANGNRDIGKFESFGHTNSEIGLVTDKKIVINYESAYAPILPTSGCTGWSARINSTPDTLTACTRTGNAQYTLNLTTSATGGQTVDWSYNGATGSLTDSALVGNRTNQSVFSVTNVVATNNVAGGGSYVWTAQHFRCRDWAKTPGLNTPQDWLGTEDGNCTVRNDGGRIAMANVIDCTGADCPTAGWEYYFSYDSGAYAAVTNSCTTNQLCYDSTQQAATHGAQITAARLTTPQSTFVTGGVIAQASSFPNIDLSQNSSTEIQGMFATQSGLAAGKVICVRPRRDGGTVITYGATGGTACFTMAAPGAQIP